MSAQATPPTDPPVATRESFEHTQHGTVRPDPYHWMSRVDDIVVGHLVAEREWYDVATTHLAPLTRVLHAEMTTRMPATDSSVSSRHQGYSYYTVTPAEREYDQLFRRRNNGDSDDEGEPEMLLDVNALVTESGYVELGLTSVSPDNALLAWSVDRAGDEVFELHFRDLSSGQDLDEVIPRSYYGGAWSADSRSFFYTVHDEAFRPHQVWRHDIGTPVDSDTLVLEETDQQYELSVRSTRSGALVVIWAQNRDTREVWVIEAGQPKGPALSVGGRRRGVEYHAEHAVLPDGSDLLLVVTNDGATEFRVVGCPVPRAGHQDSSAWFDLRPEDPAERVERIDAFAGSAVLTSRVGGGNRLRILELDDLGSPGIVVDSAFEPGSIALGDNAEFETDRITIREESYLNPPVWSYLELATGARTPRHRREAPGHDPASYLAEIKTFESADGTPVPATILRHVDTPLDGSAPCLMYAYGAYESVYPDREWDAAIPSLLDRGVVYVHAHVRGGGEGGRRWWLDGRLAAKQHTFDDHIAVADGLAAAGLVDGTRIATRGLSAGGLLQGAVFSQRPDRWRAVVAEVPFVDVVTTMFDASIPLTANEWDEWGDPRRPADFAWMLAYSPYENPPPAGGRPDLLATGALHDPRVMVFEPAKWVARLRETDPEWGPRCLFRVETGAGAHVGPAGRFAHLGYEAEVYAWVLDRLGIATTTDSRVSSE